jgi:hypothetical protein
VTLPAQDASNWNDPICACPWPQTIFFNYYLEDASVEGGCLRVIPGSHRKRISLHDHLVTAHEGGGGNDGGARQVAEAIESSGGRVEDHPMFMDHPNQVNVLSKAGSLVLGDMRLLHAAHRNRKPTRRNLLLIWHSRPETVPQFWADEGRELPAWLAERLACGRPAHIVNTRVPGTGVEGIGELLRSERDGMLPPGAEARL